LAVKRGKKRKKGEGGGKEPLTERRKDEKKT